MMILCKKLRLTFHIPFRLIFSGSLVAEITIEPLGFALFLEENGTTETELLLSNTGENDVAFNILLEPVVDEEDNFNDSLIEMSAVITISDQIWNLHGTVTGAATGDPVEGAEISVDQFIIKRFTDDEGSCHFDRLPIAEYEFTFTAPDFLPSTESVEIDNEEIELNVALLHAEFTPETDEFNVILEPEENLSLHFEVTNGGTGTLVYEAERMLFEDPPYDSWQLRMELNIEEDVDDNQIHGVVYADDRFYIAGGNRGDDVNKVYVFDIDGENIKTIEGQADSYRSLTWDTDRELFWLADITSDIWATNLEGNVVESINRPGDMRTYGLAYWTDAPDGYQLYIFNRGEDNAIDEDDSVSYLLWFGLGEEFVSFVVNDTTHNTAMDTIFDIQDPVIHSFTWWVQALSGEDTVECDERFSFKIDMRGVDEPEDNLPTEFAIQAAYPNPFNSEMRVRFGLPAASIVSLGAYDLNGKLVANLVSGHREAGIHSVLLDGMSLSSGVYLLRFEAGGYNSQLKVVLVR